MTTLRPAMESIRSAAVCAWSSSPAIRPARCSASCSPSMGCDVVKVEPPAGSPTRAIGPFAARATTATTA